MKCFAIFSLILLSKLSNSLSVDRNPRIMGGEDADIREFPYIVSLIYSGSRRCSGTLLNKNWVLTAAHCEYPVDGKFLIEYGSTDLKLNGDNGKFSYVEQFIRHELFSAEKLLHDIALIKLNSSAVTGYHNSFTQLPVPGAIFTTGMPAIVAGWGIWSNDNNTVPPLQKLDTEIWHYKDCRLAFEEDITPEDIFIYSTNICAAVPDFSRAHCSGDSGGPLIVNGIQVGIVSWSKKPCTVAQYPGVFTAVASYVDWISEKSGIMFDIKMSMIQRSSN